MYYIQYANREILPFSGLVLLCHFWQRVVHIRRVLFFGFCSLSECQRMVIFCIFPSAIDHRGQNNGVLARSQSLILSHQGHVTTVSSLQGWTRKLTFTHGDTLAANGSSLNADSRSGKVRYLADIISRVGHETCRNEGRTVGEKRTTSILVLVGEKKL